MLPALLPCRTRPDHAVLSSFLSLSGHGPPAPFLPPPQDKTNMLFSGTVVTSGRARGVVVGTGAATAIGRIR